jgi:hypothetical protein
MIDLHTHTTSSDGTFTFEQLVREAERVKLNAIAITDHDNVKSAAKIKKSESRPELIPGIELSVFDKGLGYADVHVLGLFIDPENAKLTKKLGILEKERESQKRETVRKLNDLGYEITFEEVKRKAEGVVGRPHIAKTLIEKYPGEFKSIHDVFDKLLARGKPAYVERETSFSLREAVSIIKESGGLSFVAHPHLYPYDPEKLLSDFKSLGGNGVEVYYDYITNAPSLELTKKQNGKLIEKYHGLALKLGLLESGGSDFHGENKGQTLGEFGAPDALLAKLKSALGKPL